ncbi:MAG: hypothetical protein JWM59_3673 [Verrucomicrobiales bacterium]|nr:hypothetical protein [Verrucomicrobiales bacterium]
MSSPSASRTRLTGRGACLLILSLVSLVPGVLLPEPAAIQLGLLGLCLPLLAYPLARRNLRGLRISRKYADQAFAGQLFPYEVHVHNDRRTDSRGVEIEDSLAGPAERGMDAAVIPGESQVERTFSTRLLRRGTSHRARTMLMSVYPLGLWRSELELRDRVEMTVFPRPVPPRELEEAQDAALLDVDEAESARRDWTGDFHGIRGFQPGDRLKLIHWAATARSGRVMVRQFDRRLPEKFSIVFHSIRPDGRKPTGPDAFESAMELLCGLLLHCQERAIPADFTASFMGWRTVHIPNPDDLDPALRQLAAARPVPESNASALLHAISATEAGARVFLVSEVPVREWEDLLPELPFDITCLSLSELRVKRTGLYLANAAVAAVAAAQVSIPVQP